ncbi:MAG TPA: hypothetical protein VM824_04960 [Thermoleophilaceae bacterium]|nr:hypothetical protein [Thermoleophilaceae bacterium]
MSCFSTAVPRTSGSAASSINTPTAAGISTRVRPATRASNTCRDSASSPATPVATSGAAFWVVRMKRISGTLR